MKTIEFVVIFSLCIHFAYTSSIYSINNEAAAEGTADTKGKLLVLSADEASALDAAADGDALKVVDNLIIPFGGETLGDADGVESRAARSCNANSCRNLCRRLGFRFFRCSGNWCICAR